MYILHFTLTAFYLITYTLKNIHMDSNITWRNKIQWLVGKGN